MTYAANAFHLHPFASCCTMISRTRSYSAPPQLGHKQSTDNKHAVKAPKHSGDADGQTGTLPHAASLVMGNDFVSATADRLLPPHETIDDLEFYRITSRSDFHTSIRDNDIDTLNRLLTGHVFSANQASILRAFVDKQYAQKSTQAVELLRSVKAYEAFPGHHPVQFVMQAPPAPVLGDRWFEYFETAVQRENIDDIHSLLQDKKLSATDCLQIQGIVDKHLPCSDSKCTIIDIVKAAIRQTNVSSR